MLKGTASKMDTDLFAAFAARVVERLPRDLDPTVVQGWIDNPASLGRVLHRALAPDADDGGGTKPSYVVTVNYALSLEEMITAGRYDWKNDNITGKHFSVKGEGMADVEIQLVHFDCVMDSNEVIRELDKMGLRPATLPELLAFGAKFPEIQRQFPVVALGSVWRRLFGDRFVPFLYGYGDGRDLNLHVFEDGWRGYCRFAAVRK